MFGIEQTVRRNRIVICYVVRCVEWSRIVSYFSNRGGESNGRHQTFGC